MIDRLFCIFAPTFLPLTGFCYRALADEIIADFGKWRLVERHKGTTAVRLTAFLYLPISATYLPLPRRGRDCIDENKVAKSDGLCRDGRKETG